MQAEAPAAVPCGAAELIGRAAALIFDVDGTLAETEELHRRAFNHAFVRHGLDWQWDRAVYKELLRVTGGKERMRAFHARLQVAPPLPDADIAALHRIKTAHYAELIETGCCPLRPGVADLLTAARARGQRLAIATTTSHGNIDALLSCKRWERAGRQILMRSSQATMSATRSRPPMSIWKPWRG
ncbi:beta-phosphoglucomutase-like phosphatase (HAD superfamily) [Bradyrhizobium sp. i1.4.4]